MTRLLAMSRLLAGSSSFNWTECFPMTSYEYRHIVGFEETSFVGNVYYVNHLHWQGRARELFLREHAPDVLAELEHGLALITLRCSCDYLGELKAFDEVVVRMSLDSISQNRIAMRFEYW